MQALTSLETVAAARLRAVAAAVARWFDDRALALELAASYLIALGRDPLTPWCTAMRVVYERANDRERSGWPAFANAELDEIAIEITKARNGGATCAA